MPRQFNPAKWLFITLVICSSSSISTGVANESKEEKQAVPDEIIQMIQSDSAVSVSIVKSQHTENGITRIESISHAGGGSDMNQKKALVNLLRQRSNFSENAVRIHTLYYFVDILHERDFAMVNIAKEGLSIQMGKKIVFQESFTAIGLERFLDWAAAASNPPHISQNWNPTPLSEPPIQVQPKDNLMKLLLNGTNTK